MLLCFVVVVGKLHTNYVYMYIHNYIRYISSNGITGHATLCKILVF
jgi:hypothetical protein